MLTGADTYVIIPPELQSPKEKLMRNPVHRLRKALYGHPDAGTCWEVHCNRALTIAGFVPVDAWPSCYVHPATGSFLIVYVDDFLLSGEASKLAGVWAAIKEEIKLGSEGPLSHFLGCTHSVKPSPTSKDKERIEIAFDMSGYLLQSVDAYRELIGNTKPFPHVSTPYLAEDKDNTHEPPGTQAQIAQSILPKLLYAARLARPDLILPINLLSRNLTKWNAFHDRSLQRLVAYVESSRKRLLRGYVGGGKISLKLYCDADFAGCLETARSTSGMWLVLAGPDWSFPLEWCSKRQTCVAHSTPEAELVALAKGLRESALPLSSLLEQVLKTDIVIEALEDNMSTIQIINKGRSPALRHLAKTHRISLAWVAEVCSSDGIVLSHCPTDVQLADSFTKSLDRVKFDIALDQLNIR
jgi:hypothetical protein